MRTKGRKAASPFFPTKGQREYGRAGLPQKLLCRPQRSHSTLPSVGHRGRPTAEDAEADARAAAVPAENLCVKCLPGMQPGGSYLCNMEASMQAAEIGSLIRRSLSATEDGVGLFATFHMSKIGVFHTDVAGVYDRVHHNFLEIAGSSSRQIIGKVWLQSVFCDDRDRVCKEWYLSIMKNRAFTTSFRMQDVARGGLKHVTCSLVPELSDRNRTIGYFGVFVEANEYRQAV